MVLESVLDAHALKSLQLYSHSQAIKSLSSKAGMLCIAIMDYREFDKVDLSDCPDCQAVQKKVDLRHFTLLRMSQNWWNSVRNIIDQRDIHVGKKPLTIAIAP